jgi:undecaprenyl-diphosphatase
LTIIRALILGILQGATEFLPISSSGHLVLVPWLLNWSAGDGNSLAFDTLLHWGTLVAVLIYFWRDLWRILLAVLEGLRNRRPLETPSARLGWFIVVGSIPAALVGLLFEEWFELIFGKPLAAAVLLFGTAGLLILAERIASGQRGLDSMVWRDALVIGLAQALAVLPGISRSGATISVGLMQGFGRREAARYSFLLSVPAVMGAGLWQLYRLFQSGGLSGQLAVLLTGFASAATVGYLAIHTLLLVIRKRPLSLFAAYCILFGALSLVVYVARG